MLVDVEENSLELTFALIKQLLASICAMVHPGQVLQSCYHVYLVDLATGQQQMYMTMTMTITAARGRSSPPHACADESHGRMRLWLPR